MRHFDTIFTVDDDVYLYLRQKGVGIRRSRLYYRVYKTECRELEDMWTLTNQAVVDYRKEDERYWHSSWPTEQVLYKNKWEEISDEEAEI